jgi:VanZ family protein
VSAKKSRLPLYLSAYLPILVWAVLIFFLSHQPVLPGPPAVTLDFILKKIGHVTVYAVLWWFVFRSFRITQPKNTFAATWISLVIVLLYALSDEYHQSFVPGRHPGIKDIGYDMLGAGIAWMQSHRYI